MPPPFSPQDIVSLAVDADRGTAPESLTDHLKRLVAEYAFQNAYCDPDQRLAAAVRFPGYLVTNSGQWQVTLSIIFRKDSNCLIQKALHMSRRGLVQIVRNEMAGNCGRRTRD